MSGTKAPIDDENDVTSPKPRQTLDTNRTGENQTEGTPASNNCSGRVGELVDKYRLVCALGTGGMAEVFKAERVDELRSKVAIKLMQSSLASKSEYRERFKREAKILSTFNHPGIVKVFEYGELENGESFLVMELLDGKSLARYLKDQPSHCLPLPVVIQFAFEMASALATAHAAKVIHRDLKPDNVMVVPEPASQLGRRIKLVDFGIARDLSGQTNPMTMEGVAIGTPGYMSPEQLRGESLDGATDVYSLGLIIYECLSGRSPFSEGLLAKPDQILSEKPLSLNKFMLAIPRDLNDLLRCMLHSVRTERPTMDQVCRVLDALRSTRSVPYPTESISRVLPASIKWVFWAALFITLAVSAFGAGWRFVSGPQRQNVIVPQSMVHVPSGTFPLGTSAQDVGPLFEQCKREMSDSPADCSLEMFDREVPLQQIKMSAFLVDEKPVTRAEFCKYLVSSSARIQVQNDSDTDEPRFVDFEDKRRIFDLSDSHVLYDKRTGSFSTEPGYGNGAIEHVSWFGAQSYCNAIGKTLPTEAQWEYLSYLIQTPSRMNSAVSTFKDAHRLVFGLDQTATKDSDAMYGRYEWVFDQFLGPYGACEGCIDPFRGKPLDNRPLNAECSTRGCKPRPSTPQGDTRVHCRRAKRTHKHCNSGSKDTTFRCVRPISEK